jgi:DNA-directed RNA polymerase specialized sigma24 family protein
MKDSEDQTSPVRKGWELDREALDALLGALAADRNEAGGKYEALRQRLMSLFAWERCSAPDHLADEALNRLAKKVAEGARVPHLDRFAFGIARLLLHEEARKRQNRETVLRELSAPVSRPATDEGSMLDALENCLAVLPEPNRRLIERYYSENRTTLAREFDISANALRNRAMRIREQLFACVSLKRDRS